MKKTTFALIVAALGTVAARPAHAQCWGPLCAQVTVGFPWFAPRRYAPPPLMFVQEAAPPVYVPPPVYMAPPPVVYAPPPPQVIYAPPPVVYAPPPPQVIYAPPPPMIVVPRPQIVYAAPAPVYMPAPAPVQAPVAIAQAVTPRPRTEIGIGAHLTSAFLGEGPDGQGMGGVGAELRARTSPRFALEIRADVFRGADSNGLNRTETPVTMSGLLYLNPNSRLQLYLLGGLGVSFATVSTDGTALASDPTPRSEDRMYAGAQAGIGAEWRLVEHFSLYADVRGFVRRWMNRSPNESPEFCRADGACTDVSGGATLNAGAVLYF